MPTVYGESVSLRLLTRSAGLLGMDKLGLSGRDVTILNKLIHKPHGILLVTGPTGSGKSTSLYAWLHTINSIDKRILTIEEPIEYEMAGINQIQVRPEIGLTFAVGLRHILRQDPDVIMVGEVRDKETAEIAIRAALTGHLVFSTLHTNDAAGAITRLVDMGIEPFLVASSIEALIAQRLVRRLCPVCRRPWKVDESVLANAELEGRNDLRSRRLRGLPSDRVSWPDGYLRDFARGRLHPPAGHRARIQQRDQDRGAGRASPPSKRSCAFPKKTRRSPRRKKDRTASRTCPTPRHITCENTRPTALVLLF